MLAPVGIATCCQFYSGCTLLRKWSLQWCFRCAFEPFKYLHQRQRVLSTVIEQRLPQTLTFSLIPGASYKRHPGQPRVLTIRYRHAVIAHVGNKSRQHGLQGIRPCERWMVDVVPDDGKQIPEAVLDFLDPLCELGQPRREFREPLRFKRGVDNDAAAFPE